MMLDSWQRNGWLVAHDPTPRAIDNLFTVIERDLRDARIRRLSPDWRMAIAYNAALQTANAALNASGFESSREAHHYRAISSLPHTLGLAETVADRLDEFRKLRNDAGYERAGGVSKEDAREMLELATDLRGRLITHLRGHRPELLPARYSTLTARLGQLVSPILRCLLSRRRTG